MKPTKILVWLKNCLNVTKYWKKVELHFCCSWQQHCNTVLFTPEGNFFLRMISPFWTWGIWWITPEKSDLMILDTILHQNWISSFLYPFTEYIHTYSNEIPCWIAILKWLHVIFCKNSRPTRRAFWNELKDDTKDTLYVY